MPLDCVQQASCLAMWSLAVMRSALAAVPRARKLMRPRASDFHEVRG